MGCEHVVTEGPEMLDDFDGEVLVGVEAGHVSQPLRSR